MAKTVIVLLCLSAMKVALFLPSVVLYAEEQPQHSAARRFRIDNHLVMGESILKSVTIFYDDLICDFLGDNGQITIYDKNAGTFILLDPPSRLKTHVTTEGLAEHLVQRKEAFRASDDPFRNYLAQPYFEENAYEVESGYMFFRSPWIEYRFETVSLDDPIVSELYYDYCKHLTLLNIRTSGAPTPMIRNELNPILEKNRRFPGKVGITFYPRGKVIFARVVLHAESTHTFVRRLQSTDEAKIDQAKRYRDLFREVLIDEYLREVNE